MDSGCVKALLARDVDMSEFSQRMPTVTSAPPLQGGHDPTRPEQCKGFEPWIYDLPLKRWKFQIRLPGSLPPVVCAGTYLLSLPSIPCWYWLLVEFCWWSSWYLICLLIRSCLSLVTEGELFFFRHTIISIVLKNFSHCLCHIVYNSKFTTYSSHLPFGMVYQWFQLHANIFIVAICDVNACPQYNFSRLWAVEEWSEAFRKQRIVCTISLLVPSSLQVYPT